MKPDVVYNHWDNMIYVKTNGDKIYVTCDKETQMDEVVEKMVTDNCKLLDYEEYTENGDAKWILTFNVCDSDYEMASEFN